MRRARRKSPIGNNGRPQIHPQNCPSLRRSAPPSNTPIPRRMHHLKQHLDPFSRFATIQSRQRDRQSHKHTNVLGENVLSCILRSCIFSRAVCSALPGDQSSQAVQCEQTLCRLPTAVRVAVPFEVAPTPAWTRTDVVNEMRSISNKAIVSDRYSRESVACIYARAAATLSGGFRRRGVATSKNVGWACVANVRSACL